MSNRQRRQLNRLQSSGKCRFYGKRFARRHYVERMLGSLGPEEMNSRFGYDDRSTLGGTSDRKIRNRSLFPTRCAMMAVAAVWWFT